MCKKIFVLCFISTLIFGLTGCKGGSPEKVVTGYLTALQALDFEKINEYTDTNPDAAVLDDTKVAEEDVMTQKMMENLAFEIVSAEVNETSAIVTATIRNVDMAAVTESYMADALPLALSGLDEETRDLKFKELFASCVDENKGNLIENTVPIRLEKREGDWLIIMEPALMDATSGGLYAIQNNVESIGENTPVTAAE